MPADAEPGRETARAKINLTLEILGRREDGYHELASLTVFAELGDRLTCAPAGNLSLEIEGFFAEDLKGERDNLVLKAAEALRRHVGIEKGASLRLEKNLPLASGIGGGSADAAATLRALNRLWALGLGEEELRRIGLGLGADVPVCIASKPAFMTGLGETLEPVSLPEGLRLLLVNPRVPVPTGDIFKELAAPPYDGRSVPPPEELTGLREFVDWLNEHPNDLEEPALSIVPEIGDVLGAVRVQPGCHLARMSGSGATCFGLFDNEDRLAKAAARIAAARPKWWCVTTPVSG